MEMRQNIKMSSNFIAALVMSEIIAIIVQKHSYRKLKFSRFQAFINSVGISELERFRGRERGNRLS